MKIDTEKIFLAAYFLLMMWLGLGTLWGHTLSHDFPYGYSSSDAYQHQARVEWVKESGSYAHEYPGIVSGFKDVIGYYMPGGFQISAAFSHASGLPSYDALYFMVYFSAILAGLVLYFAIRTYDKNVAMLSLPITTLIFAKTFYIGILLGQWPFTFGTLFLAGSFWALARLEIKKSAFLVALFVAAVAVTHTSELVFVVGLVGIAFLLSIMKKEWAKAKALVAAGVMALAAGLYYIIIFTYTWGKQFGYHFDIEHVNQGFPNVHLFGDFQLWILVIMVAGMVGIYYRNAIIAFASGIVFVAAVKLLNIPAMITSDFMVLATYGAFILLFLFVLWKRKPEIVKVFGPYMLIIGYASFIGFSARAFQTRFMWPVTLAVLFGMGMHRLIIFAEKNTKIKWNPSYSAAIAVVIAAALIAMNYSPLATQGTMYPERWEMFQWMQENADSEANVLFFYGDGYDQTSMLYNSGLDNYLVSFDDYVDGLNKQAIKREYIVARNMDYGPGLPYRKGLLDFRYHLYELPDPNYDVCSYDYYVLDKVTGREQLAPLVQYNNAIRQQFANNGMDVVFENEATAVLKNNNKGGDCIGQAA